MRFLAVAVLLVFMMAIHGFIEAPGGDLMPSVMLSFGLLIFMGYLAGCYCAMVGLPHITGYLFAYQMLRTMWLLVGVAILAGLLRAVPGSLGAGYNH